MKAFRPSSTQRDILQHTRVIILRIVFGKQMNFPRFHQPIDKASCDAFPLSNAWTIFRVIHIRNLFAHAFAKIQILLFIYNFLINLFLNYMEKSSGYFVGVGIWAWYRWYMGLITPVSGPDIAGGNMCCLGVYAGCLGLAC